MALKELLKQRVMEKLNFSQEISDEHLKGVIQEEICLLYTSNVEVPFYAVTQVIQWIVVVSFLCMSIQIPVNLMLHLKNIRNRLVGLPLFLVCYVGGRLIFYAIRKIPRIPGSQVFLKNAVVISIVMVLVSYIGSVLMWKYRKS